MSPEPISFADDIDTHPPPLKTPAEMKSVRLHRALETWTLLGAGAWAPPRSAITPGAFKEFLPFLVIAEVAGEDFRFAIGGQRTIELAGGRQAGELLSGLTGSKFFDGAQRLFRRCRDAKAPLAVGPLRLVRSFAEQFDVEALTMPLSDDGTAVTGILGVVDLVPIDAHELVHGRPA